MEHPPFALLILILLLIAMNFPLFFGGSSNDELLDCLTHQFQQYPNSTLIFTPQNPNYTSILQPKNLRPQLTSQKPAFILTPYHESHIVAAIHCSKKHGMQIRVRSGGHDYEGLSYTSESSFFIVDMRNFQSIHIDLDRKTARVQVGATLGQLYYALGRKSKTLAFPAGVCPTVGVGGHFSGGGYGMISRKHAIAADHIIDAKLINANGEILNRTTMGEDLFWAIRGGGGTSFGIFVEFQVSLVTVPETVTIFKVTRMSETATHLVHRWQYIADKVDENLLLRLFVNTVKSPTGNRTILASFKALYLGQITDLLPLMEEQFPELGLEKQDCTETSWIESTLFFAGLWGQPVDVLLETTPQGEYKPIYFKGKSDYLSSPIPLDGLREIWKILYEQETPQLDLSPWGGVLNSFSESETPFPHRKGNIFMIHYGIGWRNSNESEEHIAWIRRLYGFMEPYVTKSPRAAYFNYRDLDIGTNNYGRKTSYEEASVWGHKYFKNNFRRLVSVKTEFDPSNFFRNEQSIPPLSCHDSFNFM